ncbi:MAG: chloride channel protein [Bacteroidales bacterium]|nr:chloride channel protein [Bacteroidales bacterium]
MDFIKYITKFLVWRSENLNHRKYILILSLLCGIFGGLAAVILKNSVHYTQLFLTQGLQKQGANLWYLAYPIIGIIITVFFVRFFIKDNISHGVTRILQAISKNKSYLKTHNNYSSLIASTITVGFGGSVGLEAPIVLTGASIGSNIGRIFKMDYRNTTLLLGCGVAGAIAGIFKAPITGVIFGLEVLMLDLTMWSIIPLLISGVTGALLASFLLGKEVLFSFTLNETSYLNNIPWYLLLGVATGLISVYFTHATIAIEDRFGIIKNKYKKIIVGGVILSVLLFLFPPLYGEGYITLIDLLNGKGENLANSSLVYNLKDHFWIFTGYLILVMLMKVFAMTATTSAGGVGGIFAPTLFMGGMAGFIMARIFNHLNFINVSEKNFALVGMAGMMAGVMHAPLTAIFLIAEITGGYALFIPLIAVSTISYLTSKYFAPHSIYTHRLAQRGELITHDKDKSAFILMNIDELIETDFSRVSPDATLGELAKVFSHSKRNVFPVVDENDFLYGVLTLNDIRELLLKHDMYNVIKVMNIMYYPEVFVSYYDTLEQIAEKIEESGRYNVPVIKDGKYMGFVSRAKVFSAYRRLIKDFSKE